MSEKGLYASDGSFLYHFKFNVHSEDDWRIIETREYFVMSEYGDEQTLKAVLEFVDRVYEFDASPTVFFSMERRQDNALVIHKDG